ncbi:para-aminobenzoate synthetase component 2 [Stackebrandtia endophytica]|uniref:Para-aminobenzoate synthetase component 2 n=1 Tax=Stackebrandtia endophytica TaxID=1496996 RepID=A0A543AWI3_9ACTN|nr:aminodeoxychorismate/anthranilate synthase component II [Stackebrandtia endophytica]TQL76931.1 para-aminobenzoate synthetase component 2 [Stackebrandtia endophytica]
MTDQQVRLGGPRVLVVDCRDSFVYTIVDYLASLGAAVTIRQADDIAVDELEAGDFDGVLLSPGPGAPAQAATSHAVIDRFAGVVPILGVCLGHQVIAEHYGGMVERAPQLRHGETSRIHHDGTGVFTGLDTPFTATRYHSLAVPEADLPECLRVTARSDSGVVMGITHRELPIEGVQFHPEAILSESGHDLFANWLAALAPSVAG